MTNFEIFVIIAMLLMIIAMIEGFVLSNKKMDRIIDKIEREDAFDIAQRILEEKNLKNRK